MCGIWFCLGEQLSCNESHCAELIQRRGPDATSHYKESDFQFKFHRLAIHDTSVLGIQPFFCSEGDYDYILVCNGEIYNEQDLREEYEIKTVSSSDCAILIPLFLKCNYDFSLLLNQIRGEYAMVLMKRNKITQEKDIFFGTDPLGVRPLFYFFQEQKLILSSLLKGFLKDSTNVKRCNPRVFYHIQMKKGEPLDLEIYNRPRTWICSPQNISVCNLLIDCVKRRLSSERPLGCLLSGGLDSSLVAAIASRELRKDGKRLKTFSIGMKGSPDLYYARKVASHILSDHTEFLMTEQEGLDHIKDVIWAIETWDTTTIRASIPQFLLAKKIRETTEIKVLLNGDGADECQMGYLYFHKSPSIDEAEKERDRILDDIYLYDGLRVDRCITWFGLEARTPFLDQEFVGFYRQMQPEFLVPTKQKMEKFFIRQAFSEEHPDLLPKEILWRTKEAFSDGISPQNKSWFKTLQKNLFQKEEEFYQNCFESMFGQKKVIPYRWMPRWTNTNDPSARTLEDYLSVIDGEQTST